MTTAAATGVSHYIVHGTPNWADLHTSDAEVAHGFYGSLLGWSMRSRFSLGPATSAGGNNHRSRHETRLTLMAMCDGRPSAEIIERDELFAELTLPSRWYPHIYVADILATLREVEAAGGTVLRSPQTRGGMATVATVLDPCDALFSLWQSRDQTGNPLLESTGALRWIELETPDVDAALSFYSRVFDWTVDQDVWDEESCDQIEGYSVLRTSIGPVAGVITPTIPDIPASWCPAFSVDEVDVMTRQATELGGLVITDPYDVPIGRQSVLLDPGGAVFALMGPRRDEVHPHLRLDW